MKKFLLLLAVFACSLGAMATDAVTAKVSGTSLKIGLTNETTYIAFQMDITLPKAVNATAFAAITTRLGGTGEGTTIGDTKFIVASNEISSTEETHTYRVIAYNLANAAIAGTSGDDILNITLSATVADPTTIGVSNILFVKQSDLKEVDLGTATGKNGALKGDVNHDTAVSLLDAVAVVKYILYNNNAETYKTNTGKDIYPEEADMNGDGAVTLLDAVAIVKSTL